MKYRNLLFAFVFIPFAFTSSIYDFTVNAIDGSAIHMSDFRGRRMLIVNVATKSRYSGQLKDLAQLQTLYKDSLVIIVFPSNSFGNETGTNSQISDSVGKQASVNFTIAGKVEVSGSNIHPLYAWLTDESKNGTMENPVKGDFQKFLVNAQGTLVGVFAPSVGPLSDEMQNAIKTN